MREMKKVNFDFNKDPITMANTIIDSKKLKELLSLVYYVSNNNISENKQWFKAYYTTLFDWVLYNKKIKLKTFSNLCNTFNDCFKKEG